MCKRTPPSDDIPLARRCAFQILPDLADQPDACQPGGNGTNGQTLWLSLAAFGGSCDGVLATDTGGVDRSARRRRAHCKFIVVALTSLLEISIAKLDVSLINWRAPKTARSVSNHAHILDKSALAFNRSRPYAKGSKVDRLG